MLITFSWLSKLSQMFCVNSLNVFGKLWNSSDNVLIAAFAESLSQCEISEKKLIWKSA